MLMRLDTTKTQSDIRVQRILRVEMLLLWVASICMGAWILIRQLKYAAVPHSDFGQYYKST